MAKTQHSQCRGPGLNLLRNKIPHATTKDTTCPVVSLLHPVQPNIKIEHSVSNKDDGVGRTSKFLGFNDNCDFLKLQTLKFLVLHPWSSNSFTKAIRDF